MHNSKAIKVKGDDKKPTDWEKKLQVAKMKEDEQKPSEQNP